MLFFPESLERYVSQNKERLFELRLRKDKPSFANLNGCFYPIIYKGENIITTGEDIKKTVIHACENSIYIYNDCIKNGYVTTSDGIRIGLCGQCVYNNDSIITIKDFSSLCIRFPHQVIGCAQKIFEIICDGDDVKSVLILSPPGAGKTTVIRDLARMISNRLLLNILIIDEKFEIYSSGYDLGSTCDVLSGCTKKFGFFNGIKNFSPNVIVVDELTDKNDAFGLEFASLSGVSVIATAHAKNFEDAVTKDYLKTLYDKHCFKYYVALKRSGSDFFISEVRENG